MRKKIGALLITTLVVTGTLAFFCILVKYPFLIFGLMLIALFWFVYDIVYRNMQ